MVLTMKIARDVCIQCESCIPYCPMNAIHSGPAGVTIDEGECVECGICRHAGICPADALASEDLKWPRSVRRAFSDPLVTHEDTGIPGRGTEEMKTNEVTGRLQHGWVGIAVELGRPGTGTTFRDVQRVAQAVAQHDVIFERQNPVCSLMTEEADGTLRQDILEEKVLSAIVEFALRLDDVPAVLKSIEEVAGSVDTVFSLDMACRVSPGGGVPAVARATEAGISVSINGKVNVGLGRPLAGEVPR